MVASVSRGTALASLTARLDALEARVAELEGLNAGITQWVATVTALPEPAEPRPCGNCGGTGKVARLMGDSLTSVDCCPTCSGTGVVT